MIQVYRPVNSEEKVISIPKTFMIPLFIEHGSNYLETEKRNLRLQNPCSIGLTVYHAYEILYQQ